MALNQEAFFTAIRPIFGGSLSQSQVEGINAILAAWDDAWGSDPRELAYILATPKWETGGAMQPVREVGRGKGKRYGRPDKVTGHIYYGRGLPQLTWKNNYNKAGKAIGIDLVNNPDRVLELDISARILVRGMLEGWFTGKRLADYFNDRVTDWSEARRIINKMDKAAVIAAIAKQFHAAILSAWTVAIPAPPQEPAPKGMVKSTVGWTSIATGTAGSLIAAKEALQPVREAVEAAKDAQDTLSIIWRYAGDWRVLTACSVAIVIAAGITWWRRHQLMYQQGV